MNTSPRNHLRSVCRRHYDGGTAQSIDIHQEHTPSSAMVFTNPASDEQTYSMNQSVRY